MPLPHTFLTAAATGMLWWAGHAWSNSRPELQASATPPAFAVAGSAYGSLMARVMRDSLYSYWHDGESATAPVVKPAAPEQAAAAAPPPPPGRFARLGRPAPPPPPPPPTVAPAPASWLERRITHVERLETSRTKRNTSFAPSGAHRRYINASAGWRLRLAHELDPGDAILYEILHYHIASQGLPLDTTRRQVTQLAEKAVQHGLSSRASLSDSLTSAGAAINLLNDQLQQDRVPVPGETGILRNWERLNQCLDHYRTVRRQAAEEGWWEGIPEIRREELEAHATLLEKISGTIRKQLTETKLIP